MFSELVRTRAKWTCEHCGAWFGDDKGRLHCSHHLSRRFNATRWDSRNASAHCAGCHRRLSDDPYKHAEFIEAQIGKAVYLELRAAANRTCQLKKHDRLDVRKTLQWQLKEFNKGNHEVFVGWRG